MNRGDTISLMLDYQVNGSPLEQGAYDEMELQINNQNSSKAIKKLLSDGTIVWKTVNYSDDGVAKSFTGYVADLDQEETFKLSAGQSMVQLRIKIGNQVGSSNSSVFTLGAVLSSKIL